MVAKAISDAEQQERLAQLRSRLQSVQDRAVLEAALEASGEDGFKDVALRRWGAKTVACIGIGQYWQRHFGHKGCLPPTPGGWLLGSGMSL
jgi:hypothetical protein